MHGVSRYCLSPWSTLMCHAPSMLHATQVCAMFSMFTLNQHTVGTTSNISSMLALSCYRAINMWTVIMLELCWTSCCSLVSFFISPLLPLYYLTLAIIRLYWTQCTVTSHVSISCSVTMCTGSPGAPSEPLCSLRQSSLQLLLIRARRWALLFSVFFIPFILVLSTFFTFPLTFFYHFHCIPILNYRSLHHQFLEPHLGTVQGLKEREGCKLLIKAFSRSISRVNNNSDNLLMVMW